MQPTTLPGRSYVAIGSDRISRLLFHFRARAFSPLADCIVTGQTPTFTRATAGGVVADRNGIYRTPVHSQPRFEMYDLDGDGVREMPALVIDNQTINLVLRSEELSNASWAKEGTPIVTDAAAICGSVNLSLLEDNDGAALERVHQVVAFTGDGIKSGRLLIKQGSSTTSTVQLHDDTAVASRFMTVITWTAGVPSFVTSVGTVLASRLLSNGIYEVLIQTIAVTAASTNRLYLNATSGTVGDTGTTYFGGVQLQNVAYPGSYVKTTTAAATMNAEVVTAAINFNAFNADNDDITLFAKLARPAHADAVGSLVTGPGILCVGGAAARFSMRFVTGGRQLISTIDTATTDISTSGLNIPAGQTIEVAAQFRDLTTGGKVKMDVGSGYGAESTGATAFSALGSAVIVLGNSAEGGAQLGGGLIEAKIARGLFTMQQMREAF